MKKQRFSTKDIKKTRRNAIIVFISFSAVLITAITFAALFFARRVSVESPVIYDMPEYKSLILSFALLLNEQLIFIMLFSAAVFFAINSARQRSFVSDATYNASLGIEYYRDTLEGISPALVSLLMDLKIEDKKDISAMLLRLYNKQAIEFKGEGIVVNTSYDPADDAEKDLLYMLSNGELTYSAISQWKKRRLAEAVANGYLRQSTKKQNQGLIGCLAGLVILFMLPMVLFGYAACTINSFNSRFEEGAGANYAYYEDPDNNAFITFDNVYILSEILKFAIVLLLLFGAIFLLPLYFLIRWLAFRSYHLKNGRYERTPLGDELAEKIAALRRFIREFSSFSQAQKEQVFLWNDFLVYAVVLEENKTIVKDISAALKDSGVGYIKNYLRYQ